MKQTVFFNYYFCYLVFIVYLPFIKCKDEEDVNNPSNDCKSLFEANSIVPHLLPSVPKEICAVFYKPGLIIIPGKPYFQYQIQELPEITWNYKSEKFYAVIVLGAFSKEQIPRNTSKEYQKDEIIPLENSWYHWVVVNVRKNNLKSGTTLQSFVNVSNFEPNGTHKVIYAFAVLEQREEFDFKLDNDDHSPQSLLSRYFPSMSNLTMNFGGNSVFAGNFFYVIAKSADVFRDSSPVRYLNWRRNNLMNLVKPHDYAGHGW